jgi:hypothetical protein
MRQDAADAGAEHFLLPCTRHLLWRNEGSPGRAHIEIDGASRCRLSNEVRNIMHGRLESEAQAGYCEDGLRLRHKLLKLRWMGLEREADEVADAIGDLQCRLPKVVATNIAATD